MLGLLSQDGGVGHLSSGLTDLGALPLSSLVFRHDRLVCTSVLLFHEAMLQGFPFLGLCSISTRCPFASFTPVMLDRTQSDVTPNDFIFKEGVRKACIKDITYLRLELWVCALCPFPVAIKWQ